MPLVRISIQASVPAASKAAISEAVHVALVNTFKIPEDDYFHVIEDLRPDQMVSPKQYLGVNHSEHMVFIHIIAGAGRTLDQKKALYKMIATEAAERQKDVSPADLAIFLSESNGLENFSFGNGEIQLPPHLQALAK